MKFTWEVIGIVLLFFLGLILGILDAYGTMLASEPEEEEEGPELIRPETLEKFIK